MSEPGGLDPADWATWREITAMRAAVERALEHRLQQDARISTADFDVLQSLAAAEGQRLRAGALADATGWEKSRISHQVRRMADRGLVHRAECPTDLRGTWVVLSDAGADAFASASCGYVQVLQEAFFDRLEPQQKHAMATAARTVREALQPVADHA